MTEYNTRFRNKTDSEGLSCEEIELSEVTVEALTAIMQHPHTNKYKNHVTKYAAQILYKFEKILDAERNLPELNKVRNCGCFLSNIHIVLALTDIIFTAKQNIFYSRSIRNLMQTTRDTVVSYHSVKSNLNIIY